jgi:flagellar biosynthesis protein FlhB
MPNDRKTEKPTQRRLRKARRDGDHPVSRALVGFGALTLIFVVAPFALEALFESTRQGLDDALAGVTPRPSGLALRVGVIAGPLLAAAALGAGIVGIWQTGGVLSIQPLRWDLRRLSPFGRPGRGLGSRVVALSLGLGAGLAMCAAAWFVLRDMGAALAHSVGDGHAAIRLAIESCRRLGWWALGVSLVFAIADGVFRFLEWLERHRMTPDEVRQEQRDSQGDPELRHARQRVHRELANAGTARELGRASLLVLGAPELAVALSYDPHRDVAPRVLLSGSGPVAATLAALAASLGVPIEHDTALAQALAAVPIDHEVPMARYADIARALQRAGLFRPAGPPS